jgi:catechol 2,3-dioxygenase-like lactoylglutathione lyase family enzyme
VTRDLDRLAAFYGEVFGAALGERSERDLRAGLGFISIGDAAALHVFERHEDALGGVPDALAMEPFRRGRIDHFSLAAADLAGFAEARDRLIAVGASDGTVVDFGPLVSVFFIDPDGYGVELSLAKTPEWDPPFEVVQPGPRRGPAG